MSLHLKAYKSLNASSAPVLKTLRKLYQKVRLDEILHLNLAPTTLKSYQIAIAHYLQATSSSELSPTDPQRVALYIEHLVNDPAWNSVHSINTRLHQVTASLSSWAPGLANQPLIKTLNSALSKLRTFDHVEQAVPATKDYFYKVLKTFQDLQEIEMCALLSLMWLGALRLADALRLPRSAIDVTCRQPFFQLRFQKNQKSAVGKTMLLTTSPLMPLIKKYAETVSVTQPLFFRITPGRVRYLLAAHTTMTGHSIRRGSLQAMAAAGVPESEIRLISGHRTYSQLLQYLQLPPTAVQQATLRAQEAAQ